MKRYYFSLALLLGLLAFPPVNVSAAERIRFQIRIDESLFQSAKQPVSGRLGGYIEFIEGRDHFDLYGGGLAERIANEMFEVARPQARKVMRKAA